MVHWYVVHWYIDMWYIDMWYIDMWYIGTLICVEPKHAADGGYENKVTQRVLKGSKRLIVRNVSQNRIMGIGWWKKQHLTRCSIQMNLKLLSSRFSFSSLCAVLIFNHQMVLRHVVMRKAPTHCPFSSWNINYWIWSRMATLFYKFLVSATRIHPIVIFLLTLLKDYHNFLL